jgi:hypothetical protein
LESQIKSGKIEYGVHISNIRGLEKTTRMKAAYDKANGKTHHF